MPCDKQTQTDSFDAPDELRRFLTAYRPKNVREQSWKVIADDAIDLAYRAGVPTRLRVEKDIQLLGALVAHLIERGRPLTLKEALADATLLSFDTALEASAKTRENKRGIARRLQAVHRGMPWRADRRTCSERVDGLVSHAQMHALHRVLGHAHAAPDDPDGVAFVAVLSAGRAARQGSGATGDVSAETWTRARHFARRHGSNLTKDLIRAVVTHEVLETDQPIAITIAHCGLSRRDLDLALTRARDLPDVPDDAHHDLLRGRA